MAKEINNKNIVNDAIIKDIAQAVSNLGFGTIAIKVHNSKIIQIEVSCKENDDARLVLLFELALGSIFVFELCGNDSLATVEA